MDVEPCQGWSCNQVKDAYGTNSDMHVEPIQGWTLYQVRTISNQGWTMNLVQDDIEPRPRWMLNQDQNGC